jgi:FkbM family methyltransferase
MRRELLEMADSLGIRRGLARGRDELVDVLTGARANSVHRRNHLDERHLKLLLSFVLRSDSNCLDVGAHKGLFLREFRRLAPAGHHIAYEPLPLLCLQLSQQFPEMDVRQRALSCEAGQSSFVHVVDAPAYSGLKERPYPKRVSTEKISVITERLDDHVPDGWLPTFVKIDVEGAEGLVMAGALDTFRHARPVIAFEHGCGSGELFGISDDAMHRLLCEDLGLRLFDMDGNGPLGLAQFKDELATGTRWNWVAHE